MSDLFEKYSKYEMSWQVESLLKRNPKQFKKNCNGVGSPAGFWGFFWKLTPGFILNSIWGLNIKEIANLHDNEYTVPRMFATRKKAEEHKSQADRYFKSNLRKKIRAFSKTRTFKFLRNATAKLYRFLLARCGDAAFYKNKIILDEQSNKFPSDDEYKKNYIKGEYK